MSRSSGGRMAPLPDDSTSLGNAKVLGRSKSDTTNTNTPISAVTTSNVYNNQNSELQWSWNDTNDLELADIYSWKLKKGADGKIFCVYIIHVHMKSGLKWTVDKVSFVLFAMFCFVLFCSLTSFVFYPLLAVFLFSPFDSS